MAHSDSIDVLCFSKDRPLQLEAYVHSLNRFCNRKANVHVVVNTSNKFFEIAYKKLEASYQNVYLHQEAGAKSFKKQTRDLLEGFSEQFLFGVDDTIYINPFEIFDLKSRPEVFALSHLIGLNLNFSHVSNRKFSFKGEVTEPLICWDWRNEEVSFNYPFALPAAQYRTKDVLNILCKMDAQNYEWGHPNKLESGFYTLNLGEKIPSKMLAYSQSRAHVLTINLVQEIYNNPIYLQNALSTQEALIMFNSGKKINIDFYKNKKYNSIHIGEYEISKH